MNRRFLALAVLLGCTIAGSAGPSNTVEQAHSPIALGLLIRATSNLVHAVESGHLERVHSEDMRLYATLSLLSQQAEALETSIREEAKITVLEASRQVGALHRAADKPDLAQAAIELQKFTAAIGRLCAAWDRHTLDAAKELALRHQCPMHPKRKGQAGDHCPDCEMVLEPWQPAASEGLPPPAPTVAAGVDIEPPLAVGREAHAILRLNHAHGKPVIPEDLEVVHTERIHLLLIDNSLTDYHHIHPPPAEAPGQFHFSLTPTKPGSYRVWADLHPKASGRQEYAIANIPGTAEAEPLLDRDERRRVELDDFVFEMKFDEQPLKVGEPMRGTVKITDLKGRGFEGLEPLMGAFAHLVGFHEDLFTVLHVHPSGPEISDPQARGGPELEFFINAPKPGFIRLFAQVRIGGRDRFAPFGLLVK